MNALAVPKNYGYRPKQQEATKRNRLTQFGLFTKLPIKLRHKIWQLASSPRILNCVLHDNAFPNNPLLSICRDSRAALLESYPPRFAVQSAWVFQKPTIPHNFLRFNFKKDFAEMGGDIQLCFESWYRQGDPVQHQIWKRRNDCIMSTVINKSTREMLENITVDFFEFRMVFVEHRHLFAFKSLRRIVLVLDSWDRSRRSLKPIEWKFVEPMGKCVSKEAIESQRYHHTAFIGEIKRQYPDWSAPVLEIKDKMAVFAEDLVLELAKN